LKDIPAEKGEYRGLDPYGKKKRKFQKASSEKKEWQLSREKVRHLCKNYIKEGGAFEMRCGRKKKK